MRKHEIYDKYDRLLAISPLLEVETATELGTIPMHYENTQVRRLGENWRHMDYVRYKTGAGVVGLLFNQFKDEELREKLEELGFPTDSDPYPTEVEREWYRGSFPQSFGADLPTDIYGSKPAGLTGRIAAVPEAAIDTALSFAVSGLTVAGYVGLRRRLTPQ